MLAKSVQKHAGRAKEKILQNLGKVDRTADDIFDDHLNNFNRQQASANKLQKEFNNYIRCIRAAQAASKSLMDAIVDIYEPQWTGFDALNAQTAAADSLWQDFAHKLGDQVLIPLNTYGGQFPEMKKKIEKRNRKLIDYDGQRHSFQNLQANANKRKDDVKLTKGREQLEEARRTYEILNTELHDELPALYDSRILFLVTNLQSLFATEQVFHSETAKIYAELEAIVDKLATESQRGSHTLRKQTSKFMPSNTINSNSPVQSPVKQMNNTSYQNQITTNGSSNINSQSTPDRPKLNAATNGSPSTAENNEPSYQNAEAIMAAAAAGATSLSNSPIPATSTSNAATKDGNTKPSSPSGVGIGNGNGNSNGNGNGNGNITDADANDAGDDSLTKTETDTVKSNGEVITNITSSSTTTTTTTTIADDSTITNDNNKVPGNMEKLNGNQNENQYENENFAHATKRSTNANPIRPEKPAHHPSIDSNTKPNNGNIEDNKKPLDASTTDLPPGVLYRVKATYGYVKEDVDELSFEIGDIIRVIEYDDPEDQEEGWLMGQKEGTTEKGLFPANFTRPI